VVLSAAVDDGRVRHRSAPGRALSHRDALARGQGHTKYTVIAIHQDREGAEAHLKMGFHEGWGKALDQLVEEAHKM